MTTELLLKPISSGVMIKEPYSCITDAEKITDSFETYKLHPRRKCNHLNDWEINPQQVFRFQN